MNILAMQNSQLKMSESLKNLNIVNLNLVSLTGEESKKKGVKTCEI